MKTTLLTAGSEPYAVTACVVCCSSDIAVVIGGGAAPHIGAVALASSRPSLKITALFRPVLPYYAVWAIKTTSQRGKQPCIWQAASIPMLPSPSACTLMRPVLTILRPCSRVCSKFCTRWKPGCCLRRHKQIYQDCLGKDTYTST